MLRRVASVCVARSCLAVTTTTASLHGVGAASPFFAEQQQQPVRWASTSTTTASIGSYNSNARWRNNGGRAVMPPAFDIVHWNDADASKGHLLRVLHRDGHIVLDYHRQRVIDASGDATASAAAEGTGRRGNRAEKVVTVTLPPVYMARFLGVLEGRMEKVEVQSRFTNATFVPNSGKGAHCYTLHCTSRKPTTGQAQTVDGSDVNGEEVVWTVDMDAAESLMLHRFLTQALHFNSGFGR